jgi:hypothetical protein
MRPLESTTPAAESMTLKSLIITRYGLEKGDIVLAYLASKSVNTLEKLHNWLVTAKDMGIDWLKAVVAEMTGVDKVDIGDINLALSMMSSEPRSDLCYPVLVTTPACCLPAASGVRHHSMPCCAHTDGDDECMLLRRRWRLGLRLLAGCVLSSHELHAAALSYLALAP